MPAIVDPAEALRLATNENTQLRARIVEKDNEIAALRSAHAPRAAVQTRAEELAAEQVRGLEADIANLNKTIGERYESIARLKAANRIAVAHTEPADPVVVESPELLRGGVIPGETVSPHRQTPSTRHGR